MKERGNIRLGHGLMELARSLFASFSHSLPPSWVVCYYECLAQSPKRWSDKLSEIVKSLLLCWWTPSRGMNPRAFPLLVSHEWVELCKEPHWDCDRHTICKKRFFFLRWAKFNFLAWDRCVFCVLIAAYMLPTNTFRLCWKERIFNFLLRMVFLRKRKCCISIRFR